MIDNVPAGLSTVSGSATGFSSDSKQVDVIADESSETVDLELNGSGKVTFNNKALQEGDNLVLNNIQLEVNSTPAGCRKSRIG